MNEAAPEVKVIVRVLAYIDRVFGPESDAAADAPGQRIIQKGYFAEALVEVEWGSGEERDVTVIDHHGAGELHESFTIAQQYIFDEAGVVVEPLPETPFQPKESGYSYQTVGVYVKEFLPTDAPRHAVEADLGLVRNPDFTRRPIGDDEPRLFQVRGREGQRRISRPGEEAEQ